MKIELPVLIEHVNKVDGFTCHCVRPLFLENLEVTNKNIDWAMQQLSSRLYDRVDILVGEKDIEELVRWSYTPEMQLVQIEVTLDLPQHFARIWVHVVLFEACGRMMAVCPYIPALPWFELDGKGQLEYRAAEVLRKHFREIQRNFGTEALISQLVPFEKKRTIRLSYLALYLDQMRQRKNAKSKTTTRLQELISEGKSELKQVGTNLNQLYPNGLHKAVCRDGIIERLYQMLTRHERKAVMLVGPPKVGKTAILHSVVARMAEEIKRPDHEPLRQTVWHLMPGRIISGMSMSGNWEARVSAIFAFAEDRDVTLNFSQLLGLLNTGKSSQGNLAVTDLLLQAIRRRRFRVVVELTEEQLHILRERNRALADQFEILHVAEPRQEDNIRMLLHAIRELEWKWKCQFSADLLPLVIDLTKQYEDTAAMPGKVVEWLSALAMQHQETTVTREHFLNAFRRKTGLKLTYFNESSRPKATALEIDTWFHERIVGQQVAVETMRDIVMFADSMLTDPQRPIASLFFLGPTGVGKTECAKRLAEYFFDSSEKLIRFDANELCTAQAVAKLVGTPPNGEGLLTGAIRRQPFSVVLFDEIEKGHPDLFDLLLQVIGEARLTDTMGRVASFSQAIVIFTSNLGTGRILEGFATGENTSSHDSHFMKAVTNFFRPEFINRLDRIIPFSRLAHDEREVIADRMLDEIANREGLRRRKCRLVMTPQARDWVVKQETDSQYGARGVLRLLERELTAPVSRFLAATSAENPVIIEVSQQHAALHIEGFELRQAEALPQPVWQNADWLALQTRSSQENIFNRAKLAIRNMQEQIAVLRPKQIGSVGDLSPLARLYFRLNDEVAALRLKADELLDQLDANTFSNVDIVSPKAMGSAEGKGNSDGYRVFWKQFMNAITNVSIFNERSAMQERQSQLQHFLKRLARLNDAVKTITEPPEKAIVLEFATDIVQQYLEPIMPGTLLGETWKLDIETHNFGFGPQKIGVYSGLGVRKYWQSHEGSTLRFNDSTMHVRSLVVLDDINDTFEKWPHVVKIVEGKNEIVFRGETLILPEELGM